MSPLTAVFKVAVAGALSDDADAFLPVVSPGKLMMTMLVKGQLVSNVLLFSLGATARGGLLV